MRIGIFFLPGVMGGSPRQHKGKRLFLLCCFADVIKCQISEDFRGVLPFQIYSFFLSIFFICKIKPIITLVIKLPNNHPIPSVQGLSYNFDDVHHLGAFCPHIPNYILRHVIHEATCDDWDSY